MLRTSRRAGISTSIKEELGKLGIDFQRFGRAHEKLAGPYPARRTKTRRRFRFEPQDPQRFQQIERLIEEKPPATCVRLEPDRKVIPGEKEQAEKNARNSRCGHCDCCFLLINHCHRRCRVAVRLIFQIVRCPDLHQPAHWPD